VDADGLQLVAPGVGDRSFPAVGQHDRRAVGGVKTPKQIEVWADLPRSKVGKVLKPDIRARLAERSWR
jgi:acyl-coenzyme A synthetase/AMP-(fatty) acid ligase